MPKYNLLNKGVLLLIILFTIYNLSFSQVIKRISVNPSLSYRGDILELSNYPVRYGYPGYSLEFVKQFGLRSAGVDFSTEFFKDRLSVLLSSYFRHGYLYFDKNLNKEVKSFKADLFADCIYNFGIKRKRKFKFFAGLGVGKVNLGTKFKYAFLPEIDSSGNPYLKEAIGSFSFNTARILAGVKKGRWIVMLNVIGTPDEDKQPYLSATLEGKISYSLFSFKIPVKK